MEHNFWDLPENPEEAFLVLEDRYRRECEDAVSKAGEHDILSVYYTDYIAQVLGAAEELEIVEAAFNDEVPRIENVDFSTYQFFSKRVKHYVTRLQIRHGRRIQGHSVRFDLSAKTKVHHLLAQVRDIFLKLEVEEKKRESLLTKLNILEKEVDLNRTRYDAYAALVIEVAEVTGKAVERSKILDLLDAVARVFGTSKNDDRPQLPAPKTPKRIEHKRSDMDDDIPF
ncbi:hypothetical protein [Bradyrhizobium sp. 1]|uniref:hypothetical protein n=1 Tax=Bradyrhizobium sp. 1 TaxID=241591 RepID=UPI001FFAB875|nr:hypothetical protein [Bradyrhizobium sp. 1]MCK1391623.1 hypothetical protein [Bradyrhizobium sp. 1]